MMSTVNLTPFEWLVMRRTSVMKILRKLEPDNWISRMTYEKELQRIEEELHECPEYESVFGQAEPHSE